MMMLSLSRWFLVGLLFSLGWTGPAAHAASRSQLNNQVKQLRQAYQSKSWQRVSSLAQKLLDDKSLRGYPKLRSSVYLQLGGMLYQQKLKSLAKPAFAQALRLNPASKAPQGPAAMGDFFSTIAASVAAERRFFGANTPTKKPSGPSKGGGRWHIGYLVGLPVAVLGLAGLGFGVAAGLNARANAEQANSLLTFARTPPLFPDPLITPTINAFHNEAKAYGGIANIAYLVGGVLTAGGTGLILWAVLSNRPKPASVSALPSFRAAGVAKSSSTTSATTLYTFLQAK